MRDIELTKTSPNLILWLGSAMVYFGIIIAAAHFLGVFTGYHTLGWLQVIFTLVAVALSVIYIYFFFKYVDIRSD